VTALPTSIGFDYAILDPAVADQARAAADRIRERTRVAFLVQRLKRKVQAAG
jgi:hypothetical protein